MPTLIRRAYIGLGANQGDPVATLNAAITSLRALERSSLVAASPMYVTAPMDAPGPDYINAVVSIDTALEPYALLLHLLELELVFGRKRRGPDARKNAPRSVDLDLLLVGDLIMRSTPLTLPHPRMHERAFVLRPLLDLVHDVLVPGRGSARRLVELTRDQRCVPLGTAGWDPVPPSTTAVDPGHPTTATALQPDAAPTEGRPTQGVPAEGARSPTGAATEAGAASEATDAGDGAGAVPDQARPTPHAGPAVPSAPAEPASTGDAAAFDRPAAPSPGAEGDRR